MADEIDPTAHQTADQAVDQTVDQTADQPAGQAVGAKPRSAARKSAAAAAAPALPQDFETALAELEALVSKMEDGSLPLESSLLSYKRGVDLVRVCQERLARAENQVRVLEGELLRPIEDSED